MHGRKAEGDDAEAEEARARVAADCPRRWQRRRLVKKGELSFLLQQAADRIPLPLLLAAEQQHVDGDAAAVAAVAICASIFETSGKEKRKKSVKKKSELLTIDDGKKISNHSSLLESELHSIEKRGAIFADFKTKMFRSLFSNPNATSVAVEEKRVTLQVKKRRRRVERNKLFISFTLRFFVALLDLSFFFILPPSLSSSCPFFPHLGRPTRLH